MANAFYNKGDNVYGSFYAITPSDSAVLPGPYTNDVGCRGIYVGVTGNLTVVDRNGNTVEFMAVPAGEILPIAVVQVKATGTSATGLVALL